MKIRHPMTLHHPVLNLPCKMTKEQIFESVSTNIFFECAVFGCSALQCNVIYESGLVTFEKVYRLLLRHALQHTHCNTLQHSLPTVPSIVCGLVPYLVTGNTLQHTLQHTLCNTLQHSLPTDSSIVFGLVPYLVTSSGCRKSKR